MIVDIRHGDCREILPLIESASVDAAIMDPPYPEIVRDYGCLSVPEWWALMQIVCGETRRILKPTGSAVIVLQPNSNSLGSMRGWLWEFMAWVCRDWNMVQDAWWWNISPMPEAHSIQGRLMRPSLKACVWCGPPDCYRDQDAALWPESVTGRARAISARLRGETDRKVSPSGQGITKANAGKAAERRGGVSPMNVYPVGNGSTANSAGANGHGAGTPLELAKWWTRYICPPGGTVLDPFLGSGTMGIAAIDQGRGIIGIEQMDKYYQTADDRIRAAVATADLQPRLMA